jgi:hypothetical protein
MFTRRSVISSTAARRAVGVRHLADASNLTTGSIGGRAKAYATWAQQAVRTNPQNALGLGVGVATTLWIFSALCMNKSAGERVDPRTS